MLLHLDSRDLINAFKGKPVNIDELRSALIERKTKLVYSVETIQEVVTPSDPRESRYRLETLTTIPHCYIREKKEIIRREFSAAITAFKGTRTYFTGAVVPFVSTWQVVLHPGAVRIEDQLSDQLVTGNMALLESNQDAFRNTQDAFNRYKPNFVYDRQHKLNLRVESKEIFRDAVGQTLRVLGLHPFSPIVAAELVNNLAEWMKDRPAICPGWRLLGETYSEFVQNVTDQGQLGDQPDFAHVSVSPYVDAITLDARMRGYVKSASRRLSKMLESIDYEDRLFRSLEDWLSHTTLS